MAFYSFEETWTKTETLAAVLGVVAGVVVITVIALMPFFLFWSCPS